MEMEQFIEKFAAQFYETDAAEFRPDTEFRELEEWGSMSALTIMAMIDDEYGVMLEPSVFKGLETLGELFQAVKERKPE